MKPLLPLLVVLGTAGSVFAQYGYAPMPPTPPTPPAPPPSYTPSAPTYTGYSAPAPAPTYPSYPPAGVGADVNYASSNYGYTAQPQPAPTSSYAGSGYGIGDSMRGNLLTYGYLEGHFRYTDFEEADLDPTTGFGFAVSARLMNPFFIKGSFNWASQGGDNDDDDNKGYDFSSISLGAGVYLPITPKFHFLGEVGGTYAKLSADEDELSFSNGAVYVRPAIRWTPVDAWEIQAGVTVSTADDFDSKIFDLSTYVRLFSIMDLGVGVDLGDESQSYRGGVRFRW
jgi:hypothetical protein